MTGGGLVEGGRRAGGRRRAATPAAWIAWSLAGLSAALFVATAALYVATRSAQAPSSWGTGGFGSLLIFLPFLAFPVVGALIVSRHPRNPVGWICSADGLLWMLAILTGPYAEYGLLRPGSVPYPVTISALTNWLWVPAVGLLGIYLPLFFPDGRLPSSRWRYLAWFAAVVIILVSVGVVVDPGSTENLQGVRNPFGLEEYQWLLDAGIAVVALLPVCILASAGSLILRFRRSGREARQQIKWLLFAVSLVGVVYLSIIVTTLLFVPQAADMGTSQPAWLALLQSAGLLTYAVVPVAVGVAILRYRLYDIDLVINRALVYVALTASVVGLYVFVVGYLGMLFSAASDSLPISLVATGLVAVLFSPLRSRLQRGVNRLMYGERDDPYAAISRLGRRLEDTIAPNAVLPAIVETLKEALRIPYAAIALEGDGGAARITASAGDPVKEPLRLPLAYQREPVGELLLGARLGEDGFSEADRRLLSDLALQAGVAAHAVRLTQDLKRSRERLVTAREEERRRLRRDLHDGLGAQLAGLNIQAGVLRKLIPNDPDAADALLVELKEELRAAISDIRRLVYDLRPPALDELGLVVALGRLCERYSAQREGLRIVYDAPPSADLPPWPAAVEVAVYRISQEALNNVTRHAGARTCTVRLTAREELRLEVVDDGVGLPETRPTGVGLLSMRERAEELGGECLVGPVAGGGTRVLARLPLSRLVGE